MSFLANYSLPEKLVTKYKKSISECLDKNVEGITISDRVDEGIFKAFIGCPGFEIADFKLREYPGCCGILISYNTTVSSLFRRRGVAKILMQLKMDIAKDAGYTQLMCTNVSPAIDFDNLMSRFAFTAVNSFFNRRTTNTVRIYTKDLTNHTL